MPILKEGSKGPAVTKLQTKLKELGFAPGLIDGHFGPATKKALIAFQKSKRLAADGIAGPMTMSALQGGLGNINTDSAASVNKSVASANTGGNKPKLLTEADFQEAANLLDCDVAAIKAVAEVESAGNGFLSDGRVKILFEGHQFYKFTKGAYAQTHPTICFKKWIKAHYAKGPNSDVRGARELARLNQAIALDRVAALKSASYGKFQIMGFNFPACNFQNVEDFYSAMQVSEGEQLKAFCAFIRTNKLDADLRKHRWDKFALGYNGKQYRKNKYDEKLAAAHAKYSK